MSHVAMPNQCRLTVSCFACFVLAAFSASAGGDEPALSRPPYLQMAGPDAVTVAWRTAGETRPVVRYGETPDRLDREASGEAVTTRVSPEQTGSEAPRLHSAPPGTFQYEARVTGLKPATRYYYAVCDGDRVLAGGDETYRFATHPAAAEAKPVRFWVVGDSGTGGKDQALVHEAMRSFVARTGRDLDLYLHVGDMAYGSGTDDQFQNNFFAPYEPTLRNTVCWPAMGNHEGHTSKGETGVGPYYDAYVVPGRAEAGGLPSGTEAYYSFEYGKVHFICLDSHDLDRSPTGAMAAWLRADLDRAKSDWLVAYWHHPPYTKGSHDSDKESQLVEMRTHIMPILESAGVDLVLTGHSHIYERSMLMDGAYATPTVAEGVILDDGDGDPNGDGPYRKSVGLNPHEGTIQVVAGHGGTGLGRKGSMPVMRKIIVEHGSVVVDIDGNTLTAVMVDKHGATRDLFQMVKEGRVTPERVSRPWQPEPYTPPVKTPKRKPGLAEVPAGAVPLIEPHAEWHYLAGSEPAAEWTTFDFVPEGWKSGAAGFGYGDDDDATELADMKDRYSTVYIRGEFPEVPKGGGQLGLVVNYDDAFIAYLNGQEVLRVGVGSGAGASAADLESHEADGYTYFPLKGAAKHLRPDENVLAIEGHNDNLGSSDLTLDPYLVFVPKQP